MRLPHMKVGWRLFAAVKDGAGRACLVRLVAGQDPVVRNRVRELGLEAPGSLDDVDVRALERAEEAMILLGRVEVNDRILARRGPFIVGAELSHLVSHRHQEPRNHRPHLSPSPPSPLADCERGTLGLSASNDELLTTKTV